MIECLKAPCCQHVLVSSARVLADQLDDRLLIVIHPNRDQVGVADLPKRRITAVDDQLPDGHRADQAVAFVYYVDFVWFLVDVGDCCNYIYV